MVAPFASPRMYREFARWFHLLTPPEEYALEADFYARALLEWTEIPITTVLELGSGGGNNASHLKRRFRMTLSDVSEDMLALSKPLNPECEHVRGDMRTMRLGRRFDAVFVHDAVVYMTTRADLSAAIETAFEHCEPGGAALFAPDCVRETFRPATDHGGSDEGGRGMRYLEWTWDPDATDDTYVVDYAYLFRDEEGHLSTAHDRHVCSAFPRAVWMDLLEEAGFHPRRIEGLEGETGTDIFVGVKPLS